MPRPQCTQRCCKFPAGSALLPAELDIISLLKRAKAALLLAVESANAQGRAGTLRAFVQCWNATVFLPIGKSVLCRNFNTLWLQKSASKSRAYSVKGNKGELTRNAQFSHLFLRLNNKFCFQKYLCFPYFRVIALIQSNKGKYTTTKSLQTAPTHRSYSTAHFLGFILF